MRVQRLGILHRVVNPTVRRLAFYCRDEAREMFLFGYDEYIKHAFPKVHVWLAVCGPCIVHAQKLFLSERITLPSFHHCHLIDV